MKPLHVEIPLFEGGAELRRKEPRESVVRQVEYCRFPRICAEGRPQLGHTRDLSENGLCLRSDRDEAIGSLLRLTVRSLDGRPQREHIGRVAWARPAGDGTHHLGIELVTSDPRRPLRLRYLARPRVAGAESA